MVVRDVGGLPAPEMPAIITQLSCDIMATMPRASTPELPADWLARLTQAGLRQTLATRAVLGLFHADNAWQPTHADVAQAMAARGLQVNRVTLYRLLDRLAAIGLLERQADPHSRIWRFHVADTSADANDMAPRFECDACHRQFRVTEASPTTRAAADQLLQALARLGHQAQRVDLAIHGTCAVCVEPPARRASRPPRH